MNICALKKKNNKKWNWEWIGYVNIKLKEVDSKEPSEPLLEIRATSEKKKEKQTQKQVVYPTKKLQFKI